MSFKVIILDFDGVIVESTSIKDEAFSALFKEYPQHLARIMAYHLSHNATIRYEKLKYITENILRLKNSRGIQKKLSRRFSLLVFQKIVECPFVKEAKEFLDCWREKAPIYLVSINPAGELKRILARRRLRKYFKSVYAFPWKKTAAIKSILDREKVLPRDALFIGDSYEDYRAARETKVKFIGRNSGKSFKKAKIPIARDFVEIKQLLIKNSNG